MTRALCSLTLLACLTVVFPTGVRGDDRGDGRQDAQEVTVRCDKGRTIGAALAQNRGPLTINVVGICDEHVAIDRNDVSLIAGGPGAGIHGPTTAANTLAVTGDRFVLDGLSVTGGRNAIVVSGGGRAMIRNCFARGGGNGIVGGIGIVFFQGANGTIDNCESSGNAADGLMLDAAIATITNGKFVSNGRAGIIVFHGSTARIGMTNLFAAAGNEIKDNGSAGIHVTLGSLGVIVGNVISGNGKDPNGPFGRTGITVFHSRVDLPGGNLITANAAQGVFISGSTAVIGDAGFLLPTNNIIRGNFTAPPLPGVIPAAVNVFLNSTLVMRNATVDNNTGAGIALSAQSTMTMFPSTVTGNTTNGVLLSQGSGVVFQGVSALHPNGDVDLKCLDTTSHYAGPIAVGVSTDCTAF